MKALMLYFAVVLAIELRMLLKRDEIRSSAPEAETTAAPMMPMDNPEPLSRAATQESLPSSKDRIAAAKQRADAEMAEIIRQSTVTEALTRTPEYAKATALRQRMVLDIRYGLFFDTSGLSEEALSKLKQLLLDEGNLDEDLNKAIDAYAGDPQDRLKLFRGAGSAAREELRSELDSLLGEEGVKQLAAYIQDQDKMLLVGSLRQALAGTSEQLTLSQGAELVRLLGSLSPEDLGPPETARLAVAKGEQAPIKAAGLRFATIGQNQSYIDSTGAITSNVPISSAFVSAAARVLSAPQLQVLERLRARQIAQRKMNRRFGFN